MGFLAARRELVPAARPVVALTILVRGQLLLQRWSSVFLRVDRHRLLWSPPPFSSHLHIYLPAGPLDTASVSASGRNPVFVDWRCEISQVAGCGQVTEEGEAGREQESARTAGGEPAFDYPRLPLYGTMPLLRCQVTPASPVTPQSLPGPPHSLLSLPQSCCLSGHVTHRPRSLVHTSLNYPVRQKQPCQMHSSIPRYPAGLIPPTPRCHPLLQHSS